MRRDTACALGALAGFLLVLILVETKVTAPCDRAILLALRLPGDPAHADLPDRLVAGAIMLTTLGAGWPRAILASLVAGLLAARRRFEAALALVAAWGVEALVAEGIKRLVARPRPDLAFHLVAVHKTSFPSGHAAGAMLLYPLAGWLLGGRLGAGAGIVLALAIGMTRVVLGVHWASDVAAGWLLGGAIALVAASKAQRRVSVGGRAA